MGPAIQAPFVLNCEGSLTLANAAQTRRRLLDALDSNESVLVDISDAEDLDITFVQLLISARKSAESQHKDLRLGAPDHSEGSKIIARIGVAAADLPPHGDVPVANPAPAVRIDHADQIDDIDQVTVATLVNEIGPAAVSQSLGVFFVQMIARLDVLRGLSEATDLAEIRRETHLLKGTAGTFGLRGLVANVAEFDRTAGSLGADGYRVAVERMAETLRRAQVALQPTLATVS
ncbi:STAS domain-containing protein [Hyphomicrobium sp.]|uniref:STAS domain-containing protein n=1 Tax=Hyphomicrobium sp. TaxID=82 RepID=UPI003F7124A1